MPKILLFPTSDKYFSSMIMGCKLVNVIDISKTAHYSFTAKSNMPTPGVGWQQLTLLALMLALEILVQVSI